MPINITSANSSLRIVVPEFYPGGFTVDDFAADSIFEVAALDTKEELMSADGKYHAGYIFNPTTLTISLAPTSSAGFRIDAWQSAERAAVASFGCNAVITIPALSKKYNLVNGVLFSWTITPPGQRVLGTRQAVFHFESVTGSDL